MNKKLWFVRASSILGVVQIVIAYSSKDYMELYVDKEGVYLYYYEDENNIEHFILLDDAIERLFV